MSTVMASRIGQDAVEVATPACNSHDPKQPLEMEGSASLPAQRACCAGTSYSTPFARPGHVTTLQERKQGFQVASLPRPCGLCCMHFHARQQVYPAQLRTLPAG